MKEYTSLLDINQCKLGDRLLFYCLVTTPFDPILNAYRSSVLIDTYIYDYSEGDYYYWNILIDSSDFDVQTNYIFTIDDAIGGFTPINFLVYVNDDFDAEAYITRALGLSGFNCRYYSFVWTNGQLTSFKIRIYATKAALEAAEAGSTDDPIATYTSTISYDVNYNPYQITTIKD